MLVIISDLHFQHTSRDVVRYVKAGRVREAGVRRNVTKEALQLLFAEIQDTVERRGTKEVHLVFAGDIFELWRTPLWLASGDIDLRPTLAEIGDDVEANPLRAMIHRILDAIEQENAPCWPVLRGFVREGTFSYHERTYCVRGASIKTSYVPGNHDRLVNAWPSVRRRIRELLCLEGPEDGPFAHEVNLPRSSGYGVRVRHGHEYDPWNFSRTVKGSASLEASAEDYLAPCFGDYVTVDVVARLATAFRAHYAETLRTPDARGERVRALYGSLTEFDDVRPASLLVPYLTKRIGAAERETFALLRPLLRDVYGTAAADPFFKQEAKRIGVGFFFSALATRLVDFGLRRLSGRNLARVMPWVTKLANKTQELSPGDIAQHEKGLDTGQDEAIDLVVAGHTHDPTQVPLPPGHGGSDQLFYIDSGTWRTRIDFGVGGQFGRLRAYTMVFCFNDQERQGTADDRRFESWTGHLSAGKLGPYDEKGSVVVPPDQKLVFLRCHVQSVQRELDGAELRLRCGVDGEGISLNRDKVRSGDVLTFTAGDVVDLYAQLDGELWACGHEDDGLFGSSSRDLLPWGISYLAREPSSGRFVTGPGSLVLRDRQGTTMRVDYEIVAA